MEYNNYANSEAGGTLVVFSICIKSMLMTILKEFIKIHKLN